jgi:hypothetical protein
MKNLTDFINEAANKEGLFMGATSRRTQSDFKFNAGEKVVLIKYDTDGYNAQLRDVYEIDKIGKNSIKLKGDEYIAAKKFDAYGICVERKKNAYRGNSTLYWVLYNAELTDDNDIIQLMEKGTNSWGFHPENRKASTFAAELKEYIDELHK